MNTNPALGLLGFWMLTQLVAMLLLIIGGIYVLYCLGRAAAGLDRLAGAVEEWVAREKSAPPILPGSTGHLPAGASRAETSPPASPSP